MIHSGDWKIDAEPALGPLTNEKRFRELGDEGVLALMCDSTNATREGVSPSEQAVGESLRQIIEKAEGTGGDYHVLVQCGPHPVGGACGKGGRVARCFSSAVRSAAWSTSPPTSD